MEQEKSKDMKPCAYFVGQEDDSRPWGRWKVLDVMPGIVVKKLVVQPGKRISLQRHKFRSERWVVVEGTATVRLDDKVMRLSPPEGVFLPQGRLHRLGNETNSPVTLIEIQFGNPLSEDDIERITDDFDRA